MTDALFRQEVFAIQGAIFEVNKEMGAGFLESVYQECLAIEFAKRDVPFTAHRPLALHYKGEPSPKPISPTSFAFTKSLSS